MLACIPQPHGAALSRSSLEPLLDRFALVICDEAFRLLSPGRTPLLISLVADHLNCGYSQSHCFWDRGLALGLCDCAWSVAAVDRPAGSWLERSSCIRRRTTQGTGARYQGERQRWTAREGHWMQQQLAECPGLEPMPSAANFFLIRSERSLLPVKESLERQHRILLRDCRSFQGLDDHWLRISLMQRRDNRRILNALHQTIRA